MLQDLVDVFVVNKGASDLLKVAADRFCESKTHVRHFVFMHREHVIFEMVFKNGFKFSLIHDCLAHNDEQLALLEAAVFELVFNCSDDFYLAVRVFLELDQDS